MPGNSGFGPVAGRSKQAPSDAIPRGVRHNHPHWKPLGQRYCPCTFNRFCRRNSSDPLEGALPQPLKAAGTEWQESAWHKRNRSIGYLTPYGTGIQGGRSSLASIRWPCGKSLSSGRVNALSPNGDLRRSPGCLPAPSQSLRTPQPQPVLRIHSRPHACLMSTAGSRLYRLHSQRRKSTSWRIPADSPRGSISPGKQIPPLLREIVFSLADHRRGEV